MENFRLKVFRTVAQHLNFRRAAEELCLTQPAVTLQIKALEQHLGVQLFDRGGARISLTPAGTMLLKYARKLDKLETATMAALSQFAGGQRGELRIGASLTNAQYILPHLLGTFQQQFPQVRPSVTTCNTEQVLEALAALRKNKRQGYTGSNPIPSTCERALRGGAFNYPAGGLRASNRVHHPPEWRMLVAGFRCAKDS